MNNNIAVNEELIKFYNYTDMSKEVKRIFGTLNLLKIRYNDVVLPQITQSYEIKYSSFSKNRNSKVEDYVIKKLTKEENLDKFLTKIIDAYEFLSNDERIILIETFQNGKIDAIIGSEIGFCREYIVKMRKSAVIKFLTALKLDEKYLKI